MNVPSRQRGAAALTVTVLLLCVLTLVVGFASRSLMFEQRSSANQMRSTQAFEAAEAALDWAQAMLNSSTAIDADCKPSSASGDTSFRDRFLAYDTADQRFSPRTWNDAGSPLPLRAACVLTEAGWSCSCPGAGPPVLAPPPATGAHPAFALHFVGVPRSGLVQLVAIGCDRFDAACLSGAARASGSIARAQVLLGLVPALATVPVAALTARGNVAADGALTLVNTDPGVGGLTAQAGGSIALPLASLSTLPGVPGAASLAPGDGALGGSDAQHLLTRLLGLDRARWQQLAGAQKLSCPVDCTAELAQAVGPDASHPLVWIESDLNLAGPLTLGSAERPVMLVVDGQLRFSGGIVVHGAIVSLAANWDTSATSGTEVHGALVLLGNIGGTGTPTIVYNAAVLAHLHGETGSFARVPGSWRDF